VKELRGCLTDALPGARRAFRGQGRGRVLVGFHMRLSCDVPVSNIANQCNVPVSNMSIMLARRLGQKYAFVATAVVFLALLRAAGLRSAPGVMIVPLESAFGWSRDVISLSAAIGIFLYGLAGPFAAALMQRLGIRRVLMGALLLMAASTASSLWMTSPMQL